VVLSQVDRLSEEDKKSKLKEFRAAKLKPMMLSAVSGEGLDELRDRVIESLV